MRDYKSGTSLGLPLTDYGWGPRKVLVVNKGETAAGFTVVFESAVLAKLSVLVLTLLLLFNLY